MRILQLSVILVFFSAGYAQAAESAWVSSDQVQAKLMGSGDDIAVQIRMTKGWHTYWKAPGDAGLPPRFDWSASENIAGVEIEWPAPKRFEEMGLQTFGYLDEVVFPARVTRIDAGQEASLHLKLDIMVCSDICIPQTLELEKALNDEVSSSSQKYIKFARRRVPVDGDLPDLKIDTIVAGPDAVVISAYSKKGFENVDVFTVLNDLAFTSMPEITINEREAHKALIKISKPDDVENYDGTLNVTLTNGSKAVEKTLKF